MTASVGAVDIAHYTYRVAWSAEDSEFVATCLELPSLSWLASSQVKALSGVRKIVDEVVADLAANGEKVPIPLAERHYSGRFNIRISPDLHRELAIKAADHHMSLNRFVSDRLARD
jgi:predicted HicB family RNase H-like nuclease